MGVSCGKKEDSGAASSENPKLHWNLSHTTPPDHPYNVGSCKLAEIVKERTNGRFTISVHHSGILGWEREVCEAMQMGTIEMSLPAIIGMGMA
jgi:TRAP-type C4-dicarboxylate transport system substrate-binding protein